MNRQVVNPQTDCPVCRGSLKSAPTVQDLDWTAFSCRVCGDYALNTRVVSNLSTTWEVDREKRALLSHVIRRRQGKPRPAFKWPQIEEIVRTAALPKWHEQLDLLVLWLAEQRQGYGKEVDISYEEVAAVIGSLDAGGSIFIIDHAMRKELVAGSADHNSAYLHLTFEGWNRHAELMRSRADSRAGFMAMQYGNPELDQVVNKHFRPAVARAGFQLVRLDDAQRQQAGLIDNRMRVEIRNARFLVVDLTLSNRGAYWEAGYAEGLGKPVIYTCEENFFKGVGKYAGSDGTHFDTNHHLTILWTEKTIAKASAELTATIRATLPTEAKMRDDE